MDPDLAALAAAYGVATHYENFEQREVTVDADVVVAILAQFDVDASTPEKIRAALDAVRPAGALPPTLVLRQGMTRPLAGPATVWLEDGSRIAVDDLIPGDLPLGWHRLITADAEATLVVAPEKLPAVPPAWGWMLQLYALHSADSWGAGDFADLATMTRRSAAELGAGVLLVNPVQAITPTYPVESSPYSPASRRFLNPVYLRVTDTAAFAAADTDTRAKVLALRPPATELIDYDAVWGAKQAALDLLWPFRQETGADLDIEPELRDFATFCALTERYGPDWRQWPEPLREPSGAGVLAARAELADRIDFYAWLQLLCRAQLDTVRQAAREAGMPVGVIHDLPVGVHPGGVDTWAQRDAFAGRVTVGAPPDAFSMQGQDWNLPPWRPDKLAELGYAPFRDVLRGVLAHADGIRVDHIAGLWRLWWIPPGEPPGRGTYVHYDAEAMLGILALEAHRAGAVVVGEDLGTIEPVVTETMHERGVLSSAVLWFERDWDAPDQPYVPPEEWDPAAMASITTHDLPTVAGWLVAEHVRVRAELGLLTGPAEPEYESARAEREALLGLVAQRGLAVEDPALGLHQLLAAAASALLLTAPADVVGEIRQPNLPGTIDQYPNWRIPLPVGIEDFFADQRVPRVIAPLRAARPLPRTARKA